MINLRMASVDIWQNEGAAELEGGDVDRHNVLLAVLVAAASDTLYHPEDHFLLHVYFGEIELASIEGLFQRQHRLQYTENREYDF